METVSNTSIGDASVILRTALTARKHCHVMPQARLRDAVLTPPDFSQPVHLTEGDVLSTTPVRPSSHFYSWMPEVAPVGPESSASAKETLR